jgi:mycothiol synthase
MSAATHPAFTLTVHHHLSHDESRDVAALIERITDHDGLQPLSEHVWLHLKEGGDEHGLHIVATASDAPDIPCGYAHLDVTDVVEGPCAELAVDPLCRRAGLGRMLVEELIAGSPTGRLRLWAHGEQAGAAELATSMGFVRARVLWQMRRSLLAPLLKPEVPAGIEIRPFRPGVDDQAWLELNALAFADLPDQGGWTLDDLERRLREPWFSSPGFLTAWQGDAMVGFHWTKVHGGHVGGSHPHQAFGEVYIVGVDPRMRGTGLGRALTLAGLHHLRSLGLTQAMLYVDSANAPAIALYEALGFARWDSDVLFRRSATAPTSVA